MMEHFSGNWVGYLGIFVLIVFIVLSYKWDNRPRKFSSPYSGRSGFTDGYQKAVDAMNSGSSPKQLADEFPGVLDAWDRGWISAINSRLPEDEQKYFE